MPVKLIWSTEAGDEHVAHMARVSNPNAQFGDKSPKLIKYLIDHEHWSPFEMVNACVEIQTTRDISRQILRHRSFSFQEFSGRYAAFEAPKDLRETRLQDHKNRQNSLVCTDQEIIDQFSAIQETAIETCFSLYEEALSLGVAKEQARAVLPEGLIPTKMYMNGTLRSWIHYWNNRCKDDTQKEHRDIAKESRSIILCKYPGIAEAIGYRKTE